MKNPRLLTLLFTTGLLTLRVCMATTPTADGETVASPVVQDDAFVPMARTVDHRKFRVLQTEFKSGPEVTKACLTCHEDAAKQVHKTVHWTWEKEQDSTGKMLGKKNVVNNFCVGIESNWRRCTSCHIGYGWKDNKFDFTAEDKVDCLVCHDQTGKYKKFPPGAGKIQMDPKGKEFPKGSGKIWKPIDLRMVAQNVGPTRRENCLTCHAKGGGGDAVKHGDIDMSLANPEFALDVHMSPDGFNFDCSVCHKSDNHAIQGSRLDMNPGQNHGVLTCEACHSDEPHTKKKKALNLHNRIACQTCHIPAYARKTPTKMSWDWTTAGQKKDDGKGGKKGVVKKEDGILMYHYKKGSFVWQKNVTPTYAWFNGQMNYVTLDDVIDPSGIVHLAYPSGNIDDEKAVIYPFKVHTGKQLYDNKLNKMVLPHLMPYKKGDKSAYWSSFDWQTAVTEGMRAAGKEYSGSYDFVETDMYWPTTHMVAPVEDTVDCKACHVEDGLMKDVPGLGTDWIELY